MTVESIDAGDRKIAYRAVVSAPAAEIFALLSDPHRHHEIDGSGTVKEKVKGSHQLAEGEKFSVAMKQMGLPYKITSKVTAYEQDRLIEWQHPAGHKWRWELSATSPEITTITETWDATGAKVYPVFKLFGMTGKNAQGISKTLEGLQARYAV